MELFKLPHTAKVNRIIPKNAFDNFTTPKQKKLFSDQIARIIWTHKLSTDTVNLQAKDIREIQVFRIELKVGEEIQPILDIIDKSIPYNIVFVVEFDGRIYISTSSKHPNPINEDKAVLDWTFKTGWFSPSENKYTFQLKKSIDAIYHNFCIQLSGKFSLTTKPLNDLIAFEKRVTNLEKEITKLKSSISKCKQFNKKVELNLMLINAENDLKKIKEL